MDWLFDVQTWISLLTLILLEIVLGIDNIVFLTILAGKLPEHERRKARRLGLGLALITRVLLLLGLAWVARLTAPLFSLFSHEVTGRDIVLIVGGLFLLANSTHEIHERLEGEDGGVTNRLAPTFASVLTQILLLDIVFSLDSVITAVGMARQIPVMVAAVIIAVLFMLYFSDWVSAVIEKHPTIKMLALSFLMMIGCMLVMEGFHKEVPRGYLYFAMAFSAGVEILNIRVRSARPSKVNLRQPYR